MDFDAISRERHREHIKRQARKRRMRIAAAVIFGLVWLLMVVAAIIIIRVY